MPARSIVRSRPAGTGRFACRHPPGELHQVVARRSNLFFAADSNFRADILYPGRVFAACPGSDGSQTHLLPTPDCPCNFSSRARSDRRGWHVCPLSSPCNFSSRARSGPAFAVPPGHYRFAAIPSLCRNESLLCVREWKSYMHIHPSYFVMDHASCRVV